MKSWVRKFMALQLVAVFSHGPEGETRRCDWLALGWYPELETVPAGAAVVSLRLCPAFPAFVAVKITLHTQSLSKLRSWQEAWNNGFEKCELCPSHVIPQRPGNNAFRARQY